MINCKIPKVNQSKNVYDELLDEYILQNMVLFMMTSSNGNIFRVTGPLCGEFIGHRWIPHHKGQWRGALMFSLICARTNGWENTRDEKWFERPSHSLWRHCNVPGQITRCIWLQYLRYPMERGVCDTITVKSHERHVVLNHQSFNRLFNSVCRSTSKKHQCPHYWPLVRGIHWWSVNSHRKGPATRKMFPFDDAIPISAPRFVH